MAETITAKKSKRKTTKSSSDAPKSPSRPKTTKSTRASRTAAAGKITNYTSALKWLYSHVDHERMRIVSYNNRTFSLDRMRKLLSMLDNPHQQLKCVQVAGTKGKGSTCAMLASMLQACGYTVGLYTSPHLVDLSERVAINGQVISHAELTELFKLIANKEKNLPGNQKLSFFEILTAAALRYFADQAIDIAVLETGLGGRLDATTVVTPLVTGITQISLDHTNVLGHDLESIAREKAGIFKKGVVAVSVEQEAGVAKMLSDVATEVGAPMCYTGKDVEFSYRFEASRELGPHTRVCLTTSTSRWDHLPVPLRGEHQAQNCGLALAMLDQLKAHDFKISDERVITGLSQTRLAGRLEQVWASPRVIIDGAHNAASLQALVRSLGAHISYDSLVLIFGCGEDKDIPGMLKQISLGADKVIFTRAKANPRAMEPEELYSRFQDISGKMAQIAPNLHEALQLAARAVSREDLICVTGSFYLAGEAKKHFVERQSKINAM